jgi:hypothetical protein
MHDVVSCIQYDIDEMARLAKRTMALLAASDRSTSPIRYRSAVEETIRIRVLWASHVRLSHEIYAFILLRDPRFKGCLNEFEAEQQDLTRELQLLTPVQWPRSTHSGLNSLRVRAYQTLPRMMRQLEREELTVLALLRRWVYGGATTSAAIIEHESRGVTHEIASA